ncbi:acetolactate synthase-1/2/3 large subunit [Arthrobacter sp. SLBN-100]|uniref:thiamine pyrophosphate-binding protein n=1 Tax=Arthrobacter sp. SLBN-100 TaxID=2768450 RepID=UPI00115443F5|nr:thiamine pyrophosphate-binding protein [Arthrobacter sp. SLBN-100]TQJ62130.1 acetolactate synthase-1/2/3 large subunit [Arthrobacter sp. SLBN-100]
MKRINGGEVLVRALQSLDVSTVFTLHGGHLDPAYTAADAAGIRLVDTRHEQAAGIAATGYARSTGQVGVALATAGGGVTNLVTAITNAYADGVPSVFIGGAPPLMDADALPVNSGYEQMSVMRGITKWSRQVTDIRLLSETVTRAFHWATQGRPGPVYIDIPSDVMFAHIDSEDPSLAFKPFPVSRPAPSPSSIESVLKILSSAERPVILAGGGVAYAQAGALLTRFADTTGVPILTNNKARGEISTDHPLSGRGFSALAGAAKAGTPADVVVLLGARRGIYTGGRRTPLISTSATVIQVDVLAEEIGRLGQVHLGVVADASEFLRAALESASTVNWPDFSTWAQALRPKAAQAEVSGNGAISPEALATVVSELVPEDTIYVLDGGETPAWMDPRASVTGPGSWLAHGYLGIMGEGLPLAVGAKTGNPERPVVCFTGDGAVGFNISEFDTMVRHELPIVVIVNNDAQWAMSSHGQDLLYGPGNRVVTELRHTRYDLVAEGFGAHGELVESLDQLPEAIERSFASGLPACINVITNGQDIATVTKRMIGAAADGLVSPAGGSRVPYADILEVV